MESRHDKELKYISRNLPRLFSYCYMLIPLFFIIRTLNREQIIFFSLQKGNINWGVLSDFFFNINKMQNTGDDMTIFAVSKTFLGNNAAFINRKNSLPPWTVISVYFLKLKGDWLFFKNSCSLCFLFTSLQYLFFC